MLILMKRLKTWNSLALLALHVRTRQVLTEIPALPLGMGILVLTLCRNSKFPQHPTVPFLLFCTFRVQDASSDFMGNTAWRRRKWRGRKAILGFLLSHPDRCEQDTNLFVLENGRDQERKKRDERKMGKVREWKIKRGL